MATTVGDGVDVKGFQIVPEKAMSASSDDITIHAHDPFAHSVSEDGTVRFKAPSNHPAQNVDGFDLGVAIPELDGKDTVMICAHIATADTGTVDLLEAGSGTVMDSVRVIPERVAKADFLLPPSKPVTDVMLRFISRHTQKGLYVKISSPGIARAGPASAWGLQT